MIRAVFLDAGNTLLRMNYAVIAAELERHGVRVTPAEVERAEWRARVRLDAAAFASPPRGASTESGTSAALYVRLLLEELGVADGAVVSALIAWRQTYNAPVGPWDVADPRAAPALGFLRAAGVAAAVISNSNGSVRAILERLGLAAHLDFVIDSSEVGVEKPDRRIFGLALERAGVTPAEAAYVGDLYSVDVLGARAVGMAAVLLDPGGCWGPRDCATAPDVLSAVRLLLRGRGA